MREPGRGSDRLENCLHLLPGSRCSWGAEKEVWKVEMPSLVLSRNVRRLQSRRTPGPPCVASQEARSAVKLMASPKLKDLS